MGDAPCLDPGNRHRETRIHRRLSHLKSCRSPTGSFFLLSFPPKMPINPHVQLMFTMFIVIVNNRRQSGGSTEFDGWNAIRRHPLTPDPSPRRARGVRTPNLFLRKKQSLPQRLPSPLWGRGVGGEGVGSGEKCNTQIPQGPRNQRVCHDR